MTYKTRTHIWPVGLVSLALFGLLAAAIVVYALPTQTAQAHGCDDAATAQANAACIAEHVADGIDHDSEHEHETNQAPVLTGTPLPDVSLRIPSQSDSIDASVAFSDPDDGDVLTYSAESNNTGVATVSIDENTGMMVITTGLTRGEATITVTATDEADASVSITFTVRVSEGYTLTAVPMRDMEKPSTYVVEELGSYTAKFSVMVGGSNDDVTVTITARVPETGGITVTDSNGLLGAGFNQEDDLEGSLTIKSEDDDDSRAFEIEGVCGTEGAIVTIQVEDDDLDEVARGYILCKEQPATVTPGPGDTSSDAFTVASYGDWEYHDVTDGFILDVANGNNHMVNDHDNKMGLLRRDEPVIHADYTLGVSDMETLADMDDGSPRRVKDDPDNELTRQEKNADVEEGQRTIQVLAGQAHVQLTVTSKESGPAYIRLLDKHMQPFGDSDMDEDPVWAGADVVGLDSQGRLALNNQVGLSAAKALAFDQYSIKTPDIVEGQPVGNSYLVGAASAMDADGNYIKDYNQGVFRFFNPCPSAGHYFYVQVYESTGKYLETTEKILCVPSPRPKPEGLVFEIDSDKPGEGKLTYRHALNAVEHTVLLVDAHSRTIVEEISEAPEVVYFNEDLGRELNDGWEYHFIVVSHGLENQFAADAVTAEVNWINHADAAPSRLTAGTPTRSHIVCLTDNAEVKALLADCDTTPPPPAELSAPTGVTATVDDSDPGAANVTVMWTDGTGADRHVVFLFTADARLVGVNSAQTDGTTTFMNVASGSYVAVVVAVENGPTGNAADIAMTQVMVTVN